MMPVGKLAKLVGRNTVRNRGELALSAFGIVVGIASFVFFLALSGGVRNVVLGEIFPLERVEVVAPKTRVAGKTFSKKLDDALVQRIAQQPGVDEVVPRMRLQFPATGGGSFDGKEIRFEVGGFADGIDPSYVDDDKFGGAFKYWEDPALTTDLKACEVTQKRVCEKGGDPLPECVYEPRYSCVDRQYYYCNTQDMKCHHRVPVIVSPTLLEIYNSSFAESHGLPSIGAMEAFIAERSLERMRFRIGLGETYVAGSNTALQARAREVEAQLIGLSPKAMSIGMTVPIQYVQDWNREFLGEEAASSYSSIIVVMDDPGDVAPFSAWLRDVEQLEVADSQGERFAMAIFIVTSLFVLISFVIVGISAINIAHTFFMQVSERRRELGLLRAVGATRIDVRLMILGEAAVIGLLGGIVGVAIALGAGTLVDWASSEFLPNFPFKPSTYFDFTAPIIAGGLVFAVSFCVLGGFLPARRAARMQPAQALAAQ